MSEDRRENDKVILDRLDKIQDDITSTKINLALNTQETSRLADYQKTTNGKVAAHEVRQQSLEANQAVMATALAEIKADSASRLNTARSWHDWALKGVIAIVVMLFYYLLTH